MVQGALPVGPGQSRRRGIPSVIDYRSFDQCLDWESSGMLQARKQRLQPQFWLESKLIDECLAVLRTSFQPITKVVPVARPFPAIIVRTFWTSAPTPRSPRTIAKSLAIRSLALGDRYSHIEESVHEPFCNEIVFVGGKHQPGLKC